MSVTVTRPCIAPSPPGMSRQVHHMGDVRAVHVPDAGTMIDRDVPATGGATVGGRRERLGRSWLRTSHRHGQLPADRRRGLVAALGARCRRRWRRLSPGTTRSSTMSSRTSAGCDRWSREKATASSPRSHGRPMPSPPPSTPSGRFLGEPWPEGADLHVRMAIHTGEAQLRDEGNYFGQTVIRCARLRAHRARRPGPRSRTPRRGWSSIGCLRSVTPHRSRDAPPEGPRTSRAGVAGGPPGPSRDPPGRCVRSTPTAQPAGPADSAHRPGGRRRRAACAPGRGAAGDPDRSRRSRQDAARARRGGGGPRPLSRAACGSSNWPASPTRRAVGATVLAAVGGHQAAGLSPGRAADRHAAGRPDAPRARQLRAPAGTVCRARRCAALARTSPSAVLATAREPLGVPGEVTWRVRSLSTPPAETSHDRAVAVAVRGRAAVHRSGPSGPPDLRGHRRQRARHRPDLPSARRHPARSRAGGGPLPADVGGADRRSSSTIASTSSRAVRGPCCPASRRWPRRSTGATTGWTSSEQVVFRRLGVFAGTFPMEGAEAVTSAMGDVDPVTVFDVVSGLVDKSLVVVDERPGRGAALPAARDVAGLRARPGACRRRARRAPRRAPDASGWTGWRAREPVLHTDDVIELVELFHDNLVAALDWSTRDPAIGLHLLRRLSRPWQGTGRPHVGAGGGGRVADR